MSSLGDAVGDLLPLHVESTLAGPGGAAARGAEPDGRSLVLDLVRGRPGLHKMAICRSTGLAWGTVSYHLSGLIASGALHGVRSGKEVHVFPPETPADHRAWLAVLQADGADRLVSAIALAREASVCELMGRLGLPRKSVQRLLDRLVAAGLACRLGRGRIRYTLCDTWAVVGRHAEAYGLAWAAAVRPHKLVSNTLAGPVILASHQPQMPRPVHA